MSGPDVVGGLHARAGVAPGMRLVLAPTAIGPAADPALLVEAGAQALLEHPDHALVVFGPVEDPDYHAHCASLVREWSLRQRAIKGRLFLRTDLAWADCLPGLAEAVLVVAPAAAPGAGAIVEAARKAGVPILQRVVSGTLPEDVPEASPHTFSSLPGFVRAWRQAVATPQSPPDDVRGHPPATPGG